MRVPSEKEVRAFMQNLPGKRGSDIPEDVYDRIHPVADGITMQIWGSHPSPEQLQWLYDNGHHEPAQIHDAYGKFPHPHAPSVRVAEYQQYAEAKQLFDQHGGKSGGR